MKVKIYQLKDQYLHKYGYESYEYITENNQEGVSPEMYYLVYETKMDDDTTLDEIFAKFNKKLPEEYLGHPVSMSDIIETIVDDGDDVIDTFYFVDAAGYVELEDFVEIPEDEQDYARIEAYGHPFEEKYDVVAYYGSGMVADEAHANTIDELIDIVWSFLSDYAYVDVMKAEGIHPDTIRIGFDEIDIDGDIEQQLRDILTNNLDESYKKMDEAKAPTNAKYFKDKDNNLYELKPHWWNSDAFLGWNKGQHQTFVKDEFPSGGKFFDDDWNPIDTDANVDADLLNKLVGDNIASVLRNEVEKGHPDIDEPSSDSKKFVNVDLPDYSVFLPDEETAKKYILNIKSASPERPFLMWVQDRYQPITIRARILSYDGTNISYPPIQPDSKAFVYPVVLFSAFGGDELEKFILSHKDGEEFYQYDRFYFRVEHNYSPMGIRANYEGFSTGENVHRCLVVFTNELWSCVDGEKSSQKSSPEQETTAQPASTRPSERNVYRPDSIDVDKDQFKFETNGDKWWNEAIMLVEKGQERELSKEEILSLFKAFASQTDRIKDYTWSRAFILPDGTVVATKSGNTPNHAFCEEEFRDWLKNFNSQGQTFKLSREWDPSGARGGLLMDHLGCIRYNIKMEHYVALPESNLTYDQYDVLEQVITYCFNGGPAFSLNICPFDGKGQAAFNWKNFSGEQVCDRIKKFYNTGELDNSYTEAKKAQEGKEDLDEEMGMSNSCGCSGLGFRAVGGSTQPTEEKKIKFKKKISDIKQ